ncbi:PilZ domain-containing protein [Roseospira goensis]|uniref:PilZ domain-containing protein n=1 Tax=Roseospira goensis TaxID=391922 RepID=A0A7W6RZQ6_9PROT|nr:PilZ domain-containing protein [Roseospira goensis]MBB4286061.1 hypothetical protein [Roseospira goensis]
MSETEDAGGPANVPPKRRKARRKKVFKGARLILGGGLSSVDCIVKDISATGARIKLPDVTQLAGSLSLAFGDGEKLEADIIRSAGVELGIRFRPGQRPTLAPPPDLLETVLFELESPWLGEVLDQLALTDAYHEPEVAEAAGQLREAYEQLRLAIEARVGSY